MASDAGVMSPCLVELGGCGHAHHAHRGAMVASQRFNGGICLAAIPVKRSGDAPEPGEYTSGDGSTKGFGASVCACNGCQCARCAGVQATLAVDG